MERSGGACKAANCMVCMVLQAVVRSIATQINAGPWHAHKRGGGKHGRGRPLSMRPRSGALGHQRSGARCKDLGSIQCSSAIKEPATAGGCRVCAPAQQGGRVCLPRASPAQRCIRPILSQLRACSLLRERFHSADTRTSCRELCAADRGGQLHEGRGGRWPGGGPAG